MITPVRKSIRGIEYWDTEEKKIIFVPNGEEPNFDVTENPKSLLTIDTPEAKKNIAIPEKELTPEVPEVIKIRKEDVELNPLKAEVEESFEDNEIKHGFVNDDGELIDLDLMKFAELKELAKKEQIEIPKGLKKKEDLINLLIDEA